MTLTADCTTLTHPLVPATNLAVTNEAKSQHNNIALFVGGFSVLNVLHNLAAFQRFDIIESQAPTIARTAILLRLISCPAIPISDRLEMFVEIYGNSKVREKTVQALNEQIIPPLIDDLYEDVQRQKQHGIQLDFSQLKHREKDDVETALKFFRSTSRQPFDIDKLLRYRNIKHLGPRYDHFDNAIDYDYHMKLCDLAPIIHKTEYFKWRKDGLAFTVRDADYTEPNRTLATVDIIRQNGVGAVKWGYFSDILASPFVGLGLQSDHKEFFEKRNGVYTHGSQEVFRYNLRQLIEKFLLGADTDEESSRCQHESTVRFLPCEVEATLSKPRLHGLYSTVVLSSSFAHHLPLVSRCLIRSSGSRLHVESVKYFLELKKEHKAAYNQRISQMAHEARLQRDGNFDDTDILRDYLVYSAVPMEE